MASTEQSVKVEAYGTFVPPTPPCGGTDCRHDAATAEVTHDETCDDYERET